MKKQFVQAAIASTNLTRRRAGLSPQRIATGYNQDTPQDLEKTEYQKNEDLSQGLKEFIFGLQEEHVDELCRTMVKKWFDKTDRKID